MLSPEQYPLIEQSAEAAQEPYIQSRAELKLVLEMYGCVSKEFTEAGKFDCFEYDDARGTDAAKHILIGDKEGGFHHLQTAMDIESPQHSAASLLLSTNDVGIAENGVAYYAGDPDGPVKYNKPKKVRRSQGFRKTQNPEDTDSIYDYDSIANPTLIVIDGIAKSIKVDKKENETSGDDESTEEDGPEESRIEGSAMFPASWSAEEVLDTAIDGALEPVLNIDTDRRTEEHEIEKKGLQIRVITDLDSKLIVTAYPIGYAEPKPVAAEG